jgi:hypothetical protein
MIDMDQENPKAGWYANLLLVIISLLIGLLMAEAIIRLWKEEPVFSWVDYSKTIVDCATTFDPHSGWKTEPLKQGLNRERRPVTVLANGLRSNGNKPPESDKRILAVGDSYTFGDQVGDDETWPAALERHLEIPVLNGGVCGYGVGQTVLRARELTPRFRPDVLIVSLIPADIWRAQSSGFYSKRKPYFDLENGIPVLRNVPLSPPETPAGMAGVINRGVEYVYDHSLFMRSMPDLRSRLRLYQNRAYTEAHHEGLEVSCRLFEQVRDMAAQYGAQPFMLMQYKFRDIGKRIALNNGASPEPDDRNMEFLVKAIQLMECSKSAGVPVIDTFIPLQQLYSEGGINAVLALYSDHMNAAGNEFVAEYVARQLGQSAGWNR